jgi:hypothetical protein
LDFFSHSLHLRLTCKLPLPINPLNLPENHVGLLSLLAGCLVFDPPFAEYGHDAIRLFRVLPRENYGERVLNRRGSTAGVLKAWLELVVGVDIVVDSGTVVRSHVLDVETCEV